MESFRLERTLRGQLVQLPCNEQEHLQLDQGAQVINIPVTLQQLENLPSFYAGIDLGMPLSFTLALWLNCVPVGLPAAPVTVPPF